LAVGRSFYDQGVRGAGEPVDGGLREHRIGGHGQPVNWDWHMFVWAQMRCELLILACGVSAGFRGGSAVC
jgi:hypothetical protein